MTKIVHVIPALTKGGAERVAVDLANQQLARGHDVWMVAGSKVDERLLRRELDHAIGLEYISEATSRAGRYIGGIGWLVRRWRWLLRQDVVHVHLTFPAVVATIIYAVRKLRRAKTPRIVETYHAVGMHIPRWHRWLHARMAACRDGLILMAQDRYWTEFLARRPRLVSMIIPNGLALPPVRKREEPAVRAYAQAAGMRTDASLTIGSVGRLVPARRPELYIPVFAEIVSAGCEVRFLIAGEGPERDRIAALAEDQGISDRLYLPGLALDPSLPRALVDLYITVNVGPITGLNGLEAAVVGLPVIAIQLLDDYVASADDWIWSSADTSRVAKEAIRLLGNADARTALAARQQDHVRSHHGIAAMAVAYEELYRAAGAAA